MKRLINSSKKILIMLLIFMTFYNFIFSIEYSVSNAAENMDSEGLGEVIEEALGTVVGLFTWIPRMGAVALANGIDKLIKNIAYIDGTTKGSAKSKYITPFDIFFNKIEIISVNFFNFNINHDTISYKVREGVARWYYVMLSVATAILLLVLIYVGIRMAISTIASEKAKYKKMLVDWIASLAIIFLMHYIIYITVSLNDAIISGLSNVNPPEGNIEGIYADIGNQARAPFGGTNALAATVIYCMLVWQTLSLLFVYFNRMIKAAFLIIIAPLVTLTYSIDKMGDNKAQAFHNWLREFITTIIIQPFHCMIYMVLLSTALDILSRTNTNTLANGLFAVLCIRFVKSAEDIFRKIFPLGNDDKMTMASGAIMAGMAFSKSKEIGLGAARAANKGAMFLKKAPGMLHDSGVNMLAGATVLGNVLSGNKNGQTFSQMMDDARAEHEDRGYKRGLSDEQLSDLSGQIDKNTGRLVGGSEEFRRKVEEKKAANPGMSTSLAAAKVRSEMSKEFRKKNFSKKHKTISKVNKAIKGTYQGARTAYHVLSSDPVIRSLAKMHVGMATGIFAGAASYGTNQGFIQSALIGGTVYNSVQSMYQNSSGTVINNVNDAVASMTDAQGDKSVQTADQAQKTINRAVGRGRMGQLDDNSDEEKEFVDEIKKALRDAGLLDDDKYIDDIRINLRKNAENGGKLSLDEIMNQTFRRMIQDNPHDDALRQKVRYGSEARQKLMPAISGLNNHENERVIYQQVQSAEQFGLTEQDVTSQAAQEYVGLFGKVPEKVDASRDGGDRSLSEDEIESLDLDEAIEAKAELEKIQEKLREDPEATEIDDELRGIETDREYIEENIEKLEKRIEDLTKEIRDRMNDNLGEGEQRFGNSPQDLRDMTDIIKLIRELEHASSDDVDGIKESYKRVLSKKSGTIRNLIGERSRELGGGRESKRLTRNASQILGDID